MTMKRRWLLVLAITAAASLAACGGVRLAGLPEGIQASKDGLWDEAITQWQAALASNPGSAALHNNLAVAYEAKGRREDAGKEYAAARRVAPDNERIRENLARFERVQDLEQPLAALADEPQEKDERSGRVVRVSFTLPGPAAADVRGYSRLLVTNFKEEASPGDVELNKWMGDYLVDELRRAFQGDIERHPVAWEGAARLDNPGFWTAAGPDGAAFLTGSVSFRSATAKALRRQALPQDGPFTAKDRGLAERRRFTAVIDAYLIPAATGKPVFHKEFTETEADDTGGRSDEVAFASLLDRIKLHLFQDLFGTERRAVRFLLSR